MEDPNKNQEDGPQSSAGEASDAVLPGVPPAATEEAAGVPASRTKELSTDEIWQTIAIIVQKNPTGVSLSSTDLPPTPEEKKRKRRKRQIVFRTLDAFATLLWAALFVKLFVVDIDRLIVQEVAPSLLWLLDFRFFLLLGGLAIGLVAVRAQKVGWPLLYIAGFPLIVAFWKFPKLIVVNLQRPAVAFGILNASTSFVLGFKPTVIALAGACLGALLIILGNKPPTVVAGMVVVMAVLLTWLFLAVRNGLRPSRFVATQQNLIGKIVESRTLETYRGPTSKLEPSNVHSWSPGDANQYVTNAHFGLLMYRVTQYWAYSLDQYRTSPSRILFSGLAILALIVELALAFALLNYGLHSIDSTQYQSSGEISFWAFLYYSFAACWFGEVLVIAPIETLAIVLKIANGILGSIVILTVFVSLVQSYRSTRTDEASKEAIAKLKKRADTFGEQVGGSFADSLEDLERRLSAFKWVLQGAAAWLADRVPKNWDPPGR